ncbi:hypothetical protein KIW84_034166 [Lathyrus oleraceus]|uniref:DUF4283 domain-containing protein n=1 Tax=Pisum sativum TaxID=3888 RepID=A0A9D4Y2R8_PEA|nr:hypothetical protein KIW84_034166 [Pisum sativum]
MAITIPKDEYQLGLEACKHNLLGRIIWSKGSSPSTVVSIRSKRNTLWSSISKWGITSPGKGFFEFSFSSIEDVRRVRSLNSWNLSPGVLKLFPWTRDFVPSNVHNTYAQVWIRIHGLSQEYWRPKIIFTIASNIDIRLCIDLTSNKPAFDRTFGHYVRVSVDMDFTNDLCYKILVGRKENGKDPVIEVTEAQIVHREAGEPSGVNKEVTIDAMEIPQPYY